MTFRPHFLVVVILVFGLVGCATNQKEAPVEPASVPENPAILQAKIDLSNAQSLVGEWRIRLKPNDPNTVNLSQILIMAEREQAAGNTELATNLAQTVMRFAQLGIQQATSQKSVQPYYPQ